MIISNIVSFQTDCESNDLLFATSTSTTGPTVCRGMMEDETPGITSPHLWDSSTVARVVANDEIVDSTHPSPQKIAAFPKVKERGV